MSAGWARFQAFRAKASAKWERVVIVFGIISMVVLMPILIFTIAFKIVMTPYCFLFGCGSSAWTTEVHEGE